MNKQKTSKTLSVAETQRLLGAEKPIHVGKLPTDPIGMRFAGAIVQERIAKVKHD